MNVTKEMVCLATERLEEDKGRKRISAWEKGVLNYAIDLLDERKEELTQLEVPSLPIDRACFNEQLEKILLNGADNWLQYAYGGGGLVYDQSIAENLCTPSELKKKQNGALMPAKNLTWLDVEARALAQAYIHIKRELFYASREVQVKGE